MNGADHNYKFGNKNNWRRWKWNRIHELLEVPPSKATVFYLAGPDDLDRQVARSHGFRDENLIAVDRCKQNVEMRRSEGKLAIADDLFAAVHWWPRTKRVDVVDADLCCGYSHDLPFQFIALVGIGVRVVAVNLLRGRDPDIQLIKTGVRDYSSLHRGNVILTVMLAALSRQIGGLELLESLTCAVNSYKSGPQVFDSVVFGLPGLPCDPTPTPDCAGEFEFLRKRLRTANPSNNAASIAAVAAHHTMRAN